MIEENNGSGLFLVKFRNIRKREDGRKIKKRKKVERNSKGGGGGGGRDRQS